MIIRRGLSADADNLTQLAHNAKRHWGYPEHWIQHWQDDLTITPDFVATNQVFVAEEDDQVLGFYALIIRQDKAELDHMWVAPEHIGSGVGKQLFLYSVSEMDGKSRSLPRLTIDPKSASPKSS